MIMNEPEPPSPPPPAQSSTAHPAQNHYLIGIGLLLVVVALWVGMWMLTMCVYLSVCCQIFVPHECEALPPTPVCFQSRLAPSELITRIALLITVDVSRRAMEPPLACDVSILAWPSLSLSKNQFTPIVKERCLGPPRYLCTSSFTFYLIPPGLSYLRSRGFSNTRLPSDLKRSNIPKTSRPASPVQEAYTLLNDHDGEPSRSSEVRPALVFLHTLGRMWQARVTRAFSTPDSPLTTKEIAHLAGTFVLLWFAANWSVNAALGYTSVSSTTILSSMSGFFTLAIGVVSGAEKFSLGRLLAVAASIVGVILVSKSDRKASDHGHFSSHWILGDLLALSSAALYALYVILMKVCLPTTPRYRFLLISFSHQVKVKEESRVDMQLFFGFVGVINMLCFWPIGVLLHYTDIEPFSLPHSQKLWFSVVLNALCTFVSDYMSVISSLSFPIQDST
ncbi:uncharacterized protein VP01_16g1 [Puccinia sorghi]|uniref:EamA domain-containing protein n=1 Tax=Puccinia sorghi TaxID=27349 RepID=A0A0L6VHI7_9BASI|nr:uncharacterized protein VP01_16g1 [Puccinia sorghi]